MKKYVSLMIVHLAIFSCAFAADQNDAATQAAREDYRAYLAELKKINEQYKEVTHKIKDVIQEEGIPVWNEATGEIEWQKGLISNDTQASIRETDSQMIVQADLPGVRKQDVQVKIEDSKILKINAVRDGGAIVRLIQLPVLADDKTPRATLESGVLTVTITKASQAKKQVIVPVQ